MGSKISVITPCLNSGRYIEKAICSVLEQDYPDYEHIVIDGGSEDGTVDILKKYKHVNWISEPDKGQVDAMNKGFARSSGDIIVYLNADDYFLCNAFSTVVPYFASGEKFVVGDVVVQHPDRYVINTPKVELWQMIRHWERMAFPNNPVGYFYAREVQEAVPFEEEFPCFMDIRFLFEAALRYTFKKIDALLGVYRCLEDTKTVHHMQEPDYWTRKNFYFIDKYVRLFPEDYQRQFARDREQGYRNQRRWQINSMLRQYDNWRNSGNPGQQSGTAVHPVNGAPGPVSRPGAQAVDRVRLPPPHARKGQLVGDHWYVNEGDTVFLVYQMGKVGSSSIYKALRDRFPTVPAYHFHYLTERRLEEGVEWHQSHDFGAVPEHIIVGQALREFLEQGRDKVNWRIISLVRDPVSLQLSMIFQNLKQAFAGIVADGRVSPEKTIELAGRLLSEFETRESHFLNWFDYEIKEPFGIDVYEYPFDRNKGYSIIHKGNVGVLLCKFENLQETFGKTMEDLLGVKDLTLPAVNIGTRKQFGDEYNRIKSEITFPRALCERIYTSKLVKHFYSADEIQDFIRRWSQPA